MSHNAWDCVPAGTPACTMFWDTPCCGCGDCCTTEKKIELTPNITLKTEVFDNGDRCSLLLSFYDNKNKDYMDDLALYSEHFDMPLMEFKSLVNKLLTVFKSVDLVDEDVTCLDDFK